MWGIHTYVHLLQLVPYTPAYVIQPIQPHIKHTAFSLRVCPCPCAAVVANTHTHNTTHASTQRMHSQSEARSGKPRMHSSKTQSGMQILQRERRRTRKGANFAEKRRGSLHLELYTKEWRSGMEWAEAWNRRGPGTVQYARPGPTHQAPRSGGPIMHPGVPDTPPYLRTSARSLSTIFSSRSRRSIRRRPSSSSSTILSRF